MFDTRNLRSNVFMVRGMTMVLLAIIHGACSSGGGGECGNAKIEAKEVCDGNNLNERTCLTQQFDGGILACAADCRSLDTSGCEGEAPAEDCDNNIDDDHDEAVDCIDPDCTFAAACSSICADCDCPIDASLSVDTSFDGAFAADLQDTLCPRRDEDFWKVTTTGSNKIVSAQIEYRKLSNIRLALEWLGPQGICINSPMQSCSASATCTPPELCDTERGGCRPSTAQFCVAGAGCDTNTTCATALGSLGAAVEQSIGGSFHRLQTNFRAAQAGDYTVKVFDQTEQEADRDIKYTLTLTEKNDPDLQEPNDTSAMATPVTLDGSGTSQAITGFLAYTADVDYFEIPVPGVWSVSRFWTSICVGLWGRRSIRPGP
ncbi:MAG: hypothetical protein R3C68_10955 [Myxococcota bacterium]